MVASQNIALRYLQRRALLLSLAPLAALFALTVTLARTYHMREEQLSRDWFAQGNSDMSSGYPAKAFEDYRDALSYDPDNNLVQLRLAEALLADGRLGEARSYFVNLWDITPGSGEVNLDLARLSSRMGETQQAIRYFQGAIYGSWDSDPASRRRAVRRELCEFLVGQGLTTDAQTEIGALAADTPQEDATAHEEIGRFFLRAGEPDRALGEFEIAMKSESRQDQWLEEAGKAAYAAGDYTKAEMYLARAVGVNPSNELAELLSTARDVLNGDPFLPGMSDEEQGSRSWRAFRQGRDRLQKCSEMNTAGQAGVNPPFDLQVLNKDVQDLKNRVTERSLSGDSQLRHETMDLVFRIEEATSRICGTPEDADMALTLIAKKHLGSNP